MVHLGNDDCDLCRRRLIARIYRTVTPNYTNASLAWWASQNPYAIKGEFFYLPHSAIGFTPFACLPFHLSEALWRILTIGMLALAVRSLSHTLHQRIGADPFFVLSITSILLAWDGARNGQTNLPLTAIIIWFAISLMHKRYWQSVFIACLGLMFKPYMIVPILLAIPIYPAFAWRFLMSSVAFAAIPFAFQKPDYVIDTYQAFGEMITEQTHPPADNTLFSDIFRTLYVFGIHLSDSAQLLLRTTAAVVTLGITFVAKKRQGSLAGALCIYALSVLYLTLFSPRIENNTYILLGPLLGWMIVELLRSYPSQVWRGLFVVAIFCVMIAQRPLSHLLLPEQNAIWLLPLCATTIAFCMYWLVTKK